MKSKLALFAAALFPLLAACSGSVAPEADPSPPAADAGAEADAPDPCSSLPEEAWCSMVLRGGVNVDPRADACCPRWLDEALVTP